MLIAMIINCRSLTSVCLPLLRVTSTEWAEQPERGGVEGIHVHVYSVVMHGLNDSCITCDATDFKVYFHLSVLYWYVHSQWVWGYFHVFENYFKVTLFHTRSITLVGEKERKILKEIIKQAKTPVKSRIIPPGEE